MRHGAEGLIMCLVSLVTTLLRTVVFRNRNRIKEFNQSLYQNVNDVWWSLDHKLRGPNASVYKQVTKPKKRFLDTNETLKRFSQFVSSLPLELSAKLSRLRKMLQFFCWLGQSEGDSFSWIMLTLFRLTGVTCKALIELENKFIMII